MTTLTQHRYDGSIHQRLYELTEALTGWLDPEFDAVHDDLEREFQELRLHINDFV